MKSSFRSRYLPRRGVDRILRYAFELAQSRPRKTLTSATKSNGLAISMPYWDERVEAMAANYPEIRWDKQHIDILCARFVMQPERFDVVVASNLFGDILSDLGPACTGTIGIAPIRQPEPGTHFPVPVRASPRFRAGYLREKHRQPDRHDLGRRHDARLPRQWRCQRIQASPRRYSGGN